jgi:hypothetical protein
MTTATFHPDFATTGTPSLFARAWAFVVAFLEETGAAHRAAVRLAPFGG